MRAFYQKWKDTRDKPWTEIKNTTSFALPKDSGRYEYNVICLSSCNSQELSLVIYVQDVCIHIVPFIGDVTEVTGIVHTTQNTQTLYCRLEYTRDATLFADHSASWTIRYRALD